MSSITQNHFDENILIDCVRRFFPEYFFNLNATWCCTYSDRRLCCIYIERYRCTYFESGVAFNLKYMAALQISPCFYSKYLFYSQVTKNTTTKGLPMNKKKHLTDAERIKP